MSKKKKRPQNTYELPNGPLYVHANGCYTIEKLFKKHMVEAVSKRIVDGHAQFFLHEKYNPKHSIERQHGGRWRLTERTEVLKAIELAKKRKSVLLIQE